MPWTVPKTWVTDEFVDAAEMNTDVRDNVSYLHSPGVELEETGGQTIAGTTWQQIVFDAASFNDDAGGTYSTTTTRITVLKSGLYEVTGYLDYAPNGNGYRGSVIRKNGVDMRYDNRHHTGDDLSTSLWPRYVGNVSANDYFELATWQNSTFVLTVNSARLTVVRIHGS